MKLLSFKHIFILGALLAAGSVQVHAADEVTGKSEELELTDSIVHDTLVLADGKLTRLPAMKYLPCDFLLSFDT